MKLTKEIKELVEKLKDYGISDVLEDIEFSSASLKTILANIGSLKSVVRSGAYADYDDEKQEKHHKKTAVNLLERLEKEILKQRAPSTLKEYVEMHAYLFENRASDTLEKLIVDTKKEMEEAETESDKKEACKEAWGKISKLMDKLIGNVARDSVYINTELVNPLKAIMKNAGVSDKGYDDFLKATLGNAKERDTYELKIQNEIGNTSKVGKKELEIEDVSDEETEEDKARAERNARESKEDDDTPSRKKQAKLDIDDMKEPEEKIILGIVKSMEGDEVTSAIIGDTTLSKSAIKDMEYEDEVMNAIDNPRMAKTRKDILKKAKELKATHIYYYSSELKDDDKEFWIIEEI